jgi:hypothetical protein
VLAGTVVEMTAEKEFAVETEKCPTCWAVRAVRTTAAIDGVKAR